MVSATGSSACNLAAVCAGQLDIYWYVGDGFEYKKIFANSLGMLDAGRGMSAYVTTFDSS
jgi:fructose-1,6-bisphosphatase/inositol monophosphatase family enzyme